MAHSVSPMLPQYRHLSPYELMNQYSLLIKSHTEFMFSQFLPNVFLLLLFQGLIQDSILHLFIMSPRRLFTVIISQLCF